MLDIFDDVTVTNLRRTVFISDPKTGDPPDIQTTPKNMQTDRGDPPDIQTGLIHWTYKQTLYILGPQTYSR